jgi:hypothetical protein
MSSTAKGFVVYVVKGEGNTDYESWIEGVYATREAAEAAVKSAQEEERAAGGLPYGDPDPDDPDGGEAPDWTADWTIHPRTVE